MKAYYSIADLQALELVGLPTTRRGLEKYVLNKQFKYREVPSRGKGGLRKEYELNDELTQLVVLKQMKSELHNMVNYEQPLEIAVVQNLPNANDLMEWQREVAENRLFVVRYIQNSVTSGIKKTKAVESFISQAVAKTLPEEMLIAVRKANAKAGEDRTVSRRSVFDWIGAVDDAEKHKLNLLSVLAPKQRATTLPAWASALLKVWGQPQKPTLTAALELLPSYLDSNIECPSYAQAYRFLNEKMGNVEVQKGRMGARELKNIKGFIRRDTSDLFATDVYTADGHCFDAEIAHPIHGKPFRPEITSIIDVATRRIVGWSIDLCKHESRSSCIE